FCLRNAGVASYFRSYSTFPRFVEGWAAGDDPVGPRRDGCYYWVFCAATRNCPRHGGVTCESDSAMWRRRGACASRPLDFDLALNPVVAKSNSSRETLRNQDATPLARFNHL